MRAGLSGRAFRLVWVGETVSLVGDAAYAVAFVRLVLAGTGSPGTLAGVLVAGAVPRGVLLLAGGAVVDRLSARTVLFAAHLTRAVAIGTLALLAAAGAATSPVLVATAAAVGVAGPLAALGVAVAYTQDVALPTWIQTRTPPEQLGRASSVLELPRIALEPVSPAAAGLLVAVDVRLAFAVAAVPVLASGGYLLASRAVRDLDTAPPVAAGP